MPDSTPAWSPDGAKIAFTRQQVDDLEIFVMNADGSNQTRLTNGPHSYEPAWSPDSARIAFASNRDCNSDIYVMNADGSNQTRITNNPGAYSSGPAWQSLPTPTPTPTPTLGSEVVWVEDAVPAGATQAGDEPWNWVSTNPTPFSGSLAHPSNL